MIASQDRSGYFGASDVEMIVGRWGSRTWEAWYMEKLGFPRQRFESAAMNAGTHWEHRILDAIDPAIEKDKQIIIEGLLLRVNYDGTTADTDHEVKTFAWEKGFKMPPRYLRQVQVQMFAGGYRKAKIHAYGLIPAEYDNYLLPVDQGRLLTFAADYDPQWINTVFLPRLRWLAEALRKGVMPEWHQE